MNVQEMRDYLDELLSHGLPRDTPVLKHWNCSGYIGVNLGLAQAWREHGEWVRYPQPYGSEPTAVVLVEVESNSSE